MHIFSKLKNTQHVVELLGIRVLHYSFPNNIEYAREIRDWIANCYLNLYHR